MPINYTKSRQQVLSKIMTALERNAGVSATYQGSIARALAEAMAIEIADLYEAIRFSVDQTSLSTASGRSLDLIGDLYGVFRRSTSEDLQIERSSFNIEFFISNVHPGNLTIPKDTIVFNDVTDFNSAQYQYKLVEPVTILAGTTRAYGRVIPNFSSADYTASKGTLTRHNFISPDGIVILCSNPKEVYSMVNMESDDMYRRRIAKAVKSSSYGTSESIRLRALGVSGVRDVRVRESSYGLGSCDVIVVPESQRISTNLVTDLFTALRAVKPVGIKLNITVAERIPINVSVNIILPAGINEATIAGIETQARLFLNRYLNSKTIGDSISYGDMESQIKMSSDFIKSVNILSVSSNGQEVPKGIYRINDDRKYMVAGTTTVFSVTMSATSI